MAFKGVQVVPDFFNGTRVIPEKNVSPELEAKLRAQHKELRDAVTAFRDAMPYNMTEAELDAWWPKYDAVVDACVAFQMECEEKYGLDVERKFWLEEKPPRFPKVPGKAS